MTRLPVNSQVNGRRFFRIMANSGVPASLVAMRANCQLNKIYSLKDSDQVPVKYLKILQSLMAKSQPVTEPA